MADIRWADLIEQRPDLAEAGRGLLYQFSVGLAFLSTVRRDGGPRVHPICPLLTDDGMYGFITSSPKCEDLRRDGRYALHSFPTDGNEDAFYVTGTAVELFDGDVRDTLSRQFLRERPTINLSISDLGEQQLFEFRLNSCLVTRTNGYGDPNPRHEIWHAR
ncbi:MAG TPA: hypothetical protein VHV31_02385 [Nitrolancea sp.]|nr:hypothetical protein [Nitrolancea sp.]